MTRLLLAFLTAAFATLAAGQANAAFDVVYHEGTRDDVRAWCAADDGVISDREDYTMCLSAVVPGTSLTCDDAGDCISTGYDLTETGSVRIPGKSVTLRDEHGNILIPSGKTFRQLPYMGAGGLDIVE
jgi:hypothetical protein